MRIYGVVKDSRTGEPLPYASVFAADANLKPTGDGILTDEAGKYDFQSKDLDDPTNYVGYSNAGYVDVYFIPDTNGGVIDAKLDENDGYLQAAIVTAKKKVKQVVEHAKKNKGWYIAGGSVAALAIGFFIYKKLKK